MGILKKFPHTPDCTCHVCKSLADSRMNVSKEWARMFLANWDRAVELWDDGYLFSGGISRDVTKSTDQREYAALCVTWLIPNGMVEPHCVAQGG